jgi:acetyl esterase
MTIDPELLPFIENLDRAWPESPLKLTAQAWRDKVENLSAAARGPWPEGMQVEDRVIGGGKRDVTVRIYRPQTSATGPLPCLMYMHGGGWVVGSHLTHDGITAAIAQQTPAVVVSVHYARAPESPYPAAVEDCEAVLEWLFEHAKELGSDPSLLFAGGDSAGGNLGTVMALRMRGKPGRELCGQVLIYPCVDTDFTRPSYISEAQAPFMKAEEMVWFWNQYCPDPARRREAFAAPLHASDLSGLPPALVTVAEHDCLRDEGTEYAQRLKEAGVLTTFRAGLGLIHGHLRARTVSRAAAEEFRAMCEWIANTAQARRQASKNKA